MKMQDEKKETKIKLKLISHFLKHIKITKPSVYACNIRLNTYN